MTEGNGQREINRGGKIKGERDRGRDKRQTKQGERQKWGEIEGEYSGEEEEDRRKGQNRTEVRRHSQMSNLKRGELLRGVRQGKKGETEGET
jgi:hypothetical protein